MALMLAPLCLSAQQSSAGLMTRAHELHEALVRKPVRERQAAEYRRIAGMMESVWEAGRQTDVGQEAEYEAGGMYVALAQDLKMQTGWAAAGEHFAALLKEAPYSVYRRNTEWALAQIEMNHLNERSEASHWLKDFIRRYPADPRAEIAHQELRGQRVSHAPIFSARVNGPLPLPLARVPARTSEPAAAPKRPEERREPETRRSAEPLAAAFTGRMREVVFGRAGAAARGGLNQILGLHVRTQAEETSVVLDLTHPVRVVRGYLPSNHRYYYDLYDSEMGSLVSSSTIQQMEVNDGRVLEVHIGQNRRGVIRLVIDAAAGALHAEDPRLLSGPPRLEVDIPGRETPVRSRPVREKPPAGLSLARSTPAPLPLQRSGERAPERRQTHPPELAASREVASVATRKNEEQAAREELEQTAVARRPPTAKPEGPTVRILKTQPVESHTPPPPSPVREVAAERSTAATASTGRLATDSATTERDSGASTQRVTRDLYTDSGDPPTRAGARSLTRVLGLKIRKIVLDAGHGGHDTGTIGPGNLYEKNVVLDVALRLGRLLHDRLGMDVIYTRKTDTFIPLQERTAIANAAHADLFLSIHANSSDDPHIRGIETYYLDFTHNPRALAVAARENATSQLSIHSLQPLIQRIALNDKQQESREFAGDLLTNLVRTTHEEDRGVKSAPFVVLIGAQMPSVLAEISFLSDPTDAHLLREGRYRQRIADALYRGIARYIDSLNGVRQLKPLPSASIVERNAGARRGKVRPVAERKP